MLCYAQAGSDGARFSHCQPLFNSGELVAQKVEEEMPCGLKAPVRMMKINA
jgi:hypothetical protein